MDKMLRGELLDPFIDELLANDQANKLAELY